MRLCPLQWIKEWFMAKRARGAATARSITLPAPVSGLNTRDALAAMDPLFASEMADWFPNATHLESRKGYEVAQTVAGMNSSSAAPGFVKYGETSLWAAFWKQSTSELILKDVVAGTSQTISGHAVPYSPSYAQFTNSAGSFVAAVFRNNDATNNYYTYDGTTWTARTAATTNSQTFSQIASFRNRLWFLTDATGKGLSVYYLPTSAITGTSVEFPLGGFASKGGILYGIGTWTRDSGEGSSDDLIVFTTTAGQAIVYQGTDPSSPTTFGLVGVFDVSRPVGVPFKYGSDLLLPCEDGLYSMNQILGGNLGPQFAITDIIRRTWQETAASAIANLSANVFQGRVTIAYSAKLNHLMICMRTFAGAGPLVVSVFLVMNPATGAWTQFSSTGMSGYNVDTLKGDIYFGQITGGGNTGTVYKFGTATTDNGVAIVPSATQAYNYLGVSGGNKQITGLRPSVTIAGNSAILMFSVTTDFNSSSTVNADRPSLAAGSYRPFLSCPAIGTAIAIGGGAAMSASGSSNAVKWYSTDVLFIPGGFV